MPSVIQTVDASACTVDTNGRPLLLNKIPGCRATCTSPNYDAVRDDKEPLAIDIEFQECKKKTDENWSHRIGRVALVNTRGKTVYDTYVRYPYDSELQVKVPPKWLGFNVEWKDLALANGAKRWSEAREVLMKLMCGRTIVGHGMRLDITAVGDVWGADTHPRIDTQHIYGQVKLSTLADRYLDDSFNFHDPTEDARATMLLYLRRHPHNGRDSFRDATIQLNNDEFPDLVTASAMRKK